MTKEELKPVLRDYDNATPHCNRYYIPRIHQRIIPKRGTFEYYQLLDLLKYLELQNKFNPKHLILFEFEA